MLILDETPVHQLYGVVETGPNLGEVGKNRGLACCEGCSDIY